MNLQNHFLIAMPTVHDALFERSVILVCEHSNKGVFGVIINKPIKNFYVRDLLDKLEIKNLSDYEKDLFSESIFNGGPVQPEYGIVIHNKINRLIGETQISEHIVMSTSLEIFNHFGTQMQPQNLLVAFGYVCWENDQILNEIRRSNWLVGQAAPEIIFEVPTEIRYEAAMKNLGIHSHYISTYLSSQLQ